MEKLNLEANANERVGAVGMTGYGKTFLMLRLLVQFEGIHVIIVDSKHAIRLPGFVVVRDEKRVLKHEKVIFRPSGSPKPSEGFYRRIWGKFGSRRKPDCVLYLDEAANLTGPSVIDDGLLLLVQAGREVGIGVWWAGQQSVRINNTLISQSDKLFLFKVAVKSDRRKLAGVWGESVERSASLPKHVFLAYGIPEVEPLESHEGIEATPLRLPA